MKILDGYMNAEPLIPLPKQRHNEALKPVQLIMLFLLWGFGLTIGVLAFLVEHAARVKAKQQKGRLVWQKDEEWKEQNKIIYPRTRLNVPVEGYIQRGMRYERSKPKDIQPPCEME